MATAGSGQLCRSGDTVVRESDERYETRSVDRRTLLRWVILGLVITLMYAVTSSSALAHGDVGLVNDRLTLEPGEMREFQGELHYHRLVGRVSADGPVTVQLLDGRAGDVVATHGPGTDFSFNELVRCCDDNAWAPHALILENAADSTTNVDITVRLVHDDLAVMVYGAEAGTRESVAIFGVVWSAIAWRVSRRKKPPITLTRSLSVTGVLVAFVAAIALIGLLRYGTGGPPALLAGLSDISVVPFNPAVSGVSMLIAIMLFLWGLAAVWWMRARPLADRVQWVASGLVLVTLVSISGLLVARTYGELGMPIVLTLVGAIPLLVVLWRWWPTETNDQRLSSHPGRQPDELPAM